MDELKIVQDIITTQEELSFKVYSWAVGFVSAFTIGLFHKSIELPAELFIICGLIIIFGFYIVARHYWHTYSSAVIRSREIEELINTKSYKTVKINYVLKYDKSIGLFGGYKLWLPYLILCIIVLTVGMWSK